MKAASVSKEVAESSLARIHRGVIRAPGVPALEHLGECIRTAATFCERFLDEARVATSLRGEDLAPAVLARERGRTVEDVVHNRNAALRRMGLPATGAVGRLLVYFPDAELADGAAQAATAGFLDLNNAPPWGSWIGYFEERDDDDSGYGAYLLAWIPRPLIDRVTVGIEVDPVQSIQWVEDTDLEIKSILQHVNYQAV